MRLAGEIPSVPFGNRTRLLQCGGAHAKLPCSLVKLETKQLVTETAHLIGVTFRLGNRGGLQQAFSQVVAVACRRRLFRGALALAPRLALGAQAALVGPSTPECHESLPLWTKMPWAADHTRSWPPGGGCSKLLEGVAIPIHLWGSNLGEALLHVADRQRSLARFPAASNRYRRCDLSKERNDMDAAHP